MLHKIFLIIGFAILVSCEDPYQIGEDGRPNMLRIGYTPSIENVDEQLTTLGAFNDFLSQKLEMPVKLTRLAGYAPQIEALNANKIDLATLGSFSFVIAEKRAAVEPLIMRGHKDTGEGIYHSVFITAREDINSMEDVKEKASELKLALGNPASTSGHLIPRKYLSDFSINYETDFKQKIHCPEHTATLMSILAGHVDVAGMSETVLLRYQQRGRLTDGEIKVLWKSDPIPTDPIVIRSELPEDFKREIQRAYLDVRHEAPEIWKGIRGSSNEDIIFWPAKTEKWDDIRRLASELLNELYR